MKNEFLNCNCIDFMKQLPDKSVDLVLTDIPYGEVTRETNGLKKIKNLDTLGAADKVTFDLLEFLPEIYRISKSAIIIFCGLEQLSEIIKFFKNKKGTTRVLVWEKTNPVPSNGQYVYLSGVELAVYFKKQKGTFNAHCKNTVFRYPIPSGKNRIHKTQKHWDLWEELILDNSNEGDLIFDPCAGSGVTAWVAKENNRNFLCCELDKDTYEESLNFLKSKKVL